METYPIYCAGNFIETSLALEVFNPYNGELAGKTWLAPPEIVQKAIDQAVNARRAMKEMPGYKRYEILSKISSLLKQERMEFAAIVCRESGKPVKYALAEVDRSVQSFTVAAEESRRLPAEYISIDWTPAGAGKEGWLRYFPVGVVAGISPFNFPLNLAVHKLAPALAAGCPVILKPSGLTPLSMLKLSRIIAATELPEGAVSVLPMDRSTGNLLVTDDRISLLSFTGSPKVGWEMKRKAGKKKVVLELGGNAGVIISKGTRLSEAIPKCISGAFSYSGQVCIHTQRIYVVKEMLNEFTQQFLQACKKLIQGPPDDMMTDIAGMIDENNAIRVENWVLEAVEQGAEILAGGKRSGSLMQPTVLTGTHLGMKVCCEEVFGPVVIIEGVEDFSQAVEMINQGCYGLQAGVFTDSIEEMNFAFSELEVGGIIINDVPTFRVDHMPYGGVKESGQGREGIRYAMHDMLEPRLLVKNR